MDAKTTGLLGLMGTVFAVGGAAVGSNHLGLGPVQAQVTTKAAAVISSLTQATGAVVTGRIISGGVAAGPEGMKELVRSGLLAALPSNPTSGDEDHLPVLAAGKSPDGTTRDIIQMPLVRDGDLICDEVSVQATGQPAAEGDAFPLTAIGCLKTARGPIAFSRI